MGLDIKALVVREETNLESFSSRIVAIDAYNAIYQFLSTIRGPDGMSLTDTYGQVTSHLTGLFYRNINFLSMGIKPVYVFDGRPPSLKSAEIERRRRNKRNAIIKYEQAMELGNTEDAKKYAQQTTSLLDGMIDDSKQILGLFGIPYVDAPSEGEATAAHLTSTGQAYASASQDYDSVLFGSRKLVRNFTNSGRRKMPSRNRYIEVTPEIIDLDKTLRALGLTREELVDVGILIGTDFNPDGFAKIGPKTALKLVKKYSRLEAIPTIQDDLELVDFSEIRRIFLEPDVANVGELEFAEVDYAGMVRYLVDDRNFSKERVESSLNRLRKNLEKRSQSLDRWM